MVTEDDISVDRGKVDTIANWRRPSIVNLLVIIGDLWRGSLRLPYL